MRLIGRCSRNHKGVGSIIGAVFVALILLSGSAFYAVTLDTTQHYNNTMSSMSDVDWNRNQENIVIKQIAITGTNQLNVTAENDGSIQSHLIYLGIFNTTATPQNQTYQALNEYVGPGEIGNIVSSSTVIGGNQYVIQLVTELGNTVESKFFPANYANCALTLVTTPPTVYQGNNITVLFTVTPNDTVVDSIQSLTATLNATPTNLVQLVGNSPLSVSGLTRGTSTFFWWTYNTTSTGTVTFNATYLQAPAGTYALSTAQIISPPQQGAQGSVTITGVNCTASQNPSQWNLFGSTQNINGSISDIANNDANYANFNSYYSGTTTNINHFVDNNSSNVDDSPNLGTQSNFTALQSGPDSIYDVLTEEYTGGYGGVSLVTATGSIPNDMDKNQLGCMGAVFFNPTSNVYTVTMVEFNASGAASQVFNGVAQGEGVSYPTSGWVNDDGKKAVNWTGTLPVQPHTSQEFFVHIDGNDKSVTFTVVVRITANSTVYSNSYTSEQTGGPGHEAPWSVLWLGQGPTPKFTETVPQSTEKTFYVSLAEDVGKVAIDSGGNLTVLVPTEFSNVKSVGGTGWGTATITGNRIQVGNTQTILNSTITYAFNATAPSNPGLYMLNVSFNGTPNTQVPVGNFSIQVTGTPNNYQLDLEAQWTNAPYNLPNKQLCIFGGTMGSEDIRVDVWNGTAWQNLFTDLTSGWNNVSVSSYLTSQNFTIRFKGGTEANDTVQDSWNIDVSLLHLWTQTDQYTAEVEFTGSSNSQSWTQLVWQVVSSWNTANVSVTIQVYNYTLGSYPSSGNGYVSYVSSATPNTDELSSQTITSGATQFRNSTGYYWKVKIRGVKSTSTQFQMRINWIELQDSYAYAGDNVPYKAWIWYTIQATGASGNPIPYTYASIYENGTNVILQNATDGTPVPNPAWLRLDASGTFQLQIKSITSSGETFVLYVAVGNIVQQKILTQVAQQ